VRAEDLDVPEASAVVATQAEAAPRLPFLIIAGALVVLGVTMVAVTVYEAKPTGLLTLLATIGALVALTGFFILSRLTPLRGWRPYAVLCIYVVSLLGSPPGVIVHGLIAICLWAAFELGIVLMRFRLRDNRI
jgi:ABC-type transport system involved in multi-copper enzyme maturation permease subunit